MMAMVVRRDTCPLGVQKILTVAQFWIRGHDSGYLGGPGRCKCHKALAFGVPTSSGGSGSQLSLAVVC